MDDADRVTRGSLVGAIAGALAASACCIGPMIAGLLGLSGAATLTALSRSRPYALGASALLIGVSFWATYHRRAVASDAYHCERPETSRRGRRLLWLSTVLATLFAAAPSAIAWTASRPPGGVLPATLQTATVIRVEGMDCAACAVPIREAIEREGCVHRVDIDIARGTVVVFHDPQAQGSRYIDAVSRLGYTAAVEARHGSNP